MKILKVAFLSLFIFNIPTSHAIEYLGNARSNGGPFGLGILLGDPTAISGKYFLSPYTAIDFAIGYGYSENDGFQVHTDYLFHPHVFTRNEDFSMSWFLGIGGAAVFGNDSNLNVRAPLGITLTFMKQPIETFLEFAPGIGVVDDFGFAFDGGIGARFYF